MRFIDAKSALEKLDQEHKISRATGEQLYTIFFNCIQVKM